MVLAMLLVVACRQTGNENKEVSGTDTVAVKKAFSAGHSKNVVCMHDTRQTYDLYLPSDYSDNRSFPVIYIFDAHARGHLPVEKYGALAEAFGYILVASNNSKNGQEPETSNYIYQLLVEETTQLFSINRARIYTMGFSGGARVATAVALSNGGVNGVIGCSAGFPKSDQPLTNNFNYIGFAGNEDFNLKEMKELDEKLNETAMRHQLIIFNGKHDWSSAQVMKEAFYWITFNAIRAQLQTASDSLCRAYLDEQDSAIHVMTKKGDVYGIYLAYEKIVNYLDGIYDVSNYKEKYFLYQNSDKVRSYESYLNRIASEETRLQKLYAENMSSRSLAWWTSEFEHLNESIRKDKKEEEKLFKKRLASYISLLAYMYSTNALKANQLDQANNYLKIYKLVDPTNAEQPYLTAVLMMKYSNTALAIAALKEAVQLGFEDKERMLNEPDFSTLQSNAEFMAIAGQMN